jgi:hypothetical protein
MAKSRKSTHKEHAVRLGEIEKYNKFLRANLKERYHFGNLSVCGPIILCWVLKKQGVSVRIRLNWHRIWPNGTIMNTTISSIVP